MTQDYFTSISIISAPLVKAEQSIRGIGQRNTINMTLSSKRLKILKDSGLNELGFSIENPSIGKSQKKYKYTLVVDKNNTKRHLFQVSDSILLKTEPEARSIIEDLALTLESENEKDVNTQAGQKYYIFYNTTPHPIYGKLRDTLQRITNIKFQDLKSIDDLSTLRLKLEGSDRDDVLKDRLETLLGLKETPQPKICGELITLQKILEKFSEKNMYSEHNWKTLLVYINPSLLKPFKTQKIQFKDLKTPERGALEIINILNRFGEDTGGLKQFLEGIKEDLGDYDKLKIEKLLSQYLPEQYSFPTEVDAEEDIEGFLSIKDRRDLIDIISGLREFRNETDRYRLIYDKAKLKEVLKNFTFRDGSHHKVSATDLVYFLEGSGQLVDRPTAKALGALLDAMLDLLEKQKDVESVLALIEKYELINPDRLKELSQRYSIIL